MTWNPRKYKCYDCGTPLQSSYSGELVLCECPSNAFVDQTEHYSRFGGPVVASQTITLTHQSKAKWPFKILAMLLYGKFPWLDRDSGVVHGSIGPMAVHLGMKKWDLGQHLRFLEDQGLLETLSTHSTHFICKIAPPHGFTPHVAKPRKKKVQV